MNKKLILSMCIVLLFLFGIGFGLCKYRPLWNDEIYTQMASVSGHSYSQIWLGHVGEGSSSPLFYVMQKAICGMLKYSTPEQWKTNIIIPIPKKGDKTNIHNYRGISLMSISAKIF